MAEMMEQKARNNFRVFCTLIDRNYQFNWHHRLIADKLEAVDRGEIKRLMIFMPPRHGKSQLASILFPAWFLGKNKGKEIITASYSGDLAQDFGGKTRDIVADQIFTKIFGATLKSDEKSKAKWRMTNKGTYTSVGVGGAVTGRGANVLIIDDPIKNREEAESDVIRDKVWNWYTSTAYTRLEKNGAIIIILTRWHLMDLAGRLLEKEMEGGEKWEVINFPALARKDEEFRKEGEALWNDKFGIEDLLQIKETIGIYDWAALYQQTPILTENQEFKQDWIQYISRKDVTSKDTRKFLTVDTAMSKKETADYTGFTENFVDKENKWNVAAYRMRLNAKEFVEYLFTLQDRHSFEKIGIEKTAYIWGLKPYLDGEQRKRNKYLPIVELTHKQTAKETRIRGLVPRYNSGSIFHIRGECKDLEEEMFTFPKSTHDDVLDSLAYQAQIVDHKKKGKRQFIPNFKKISYLR
jgi:hypothetical protein